MILPTEGQRKFQGLTLDTSLILLSACFVWSGNLARGALSVVKSRAHSVMSRQFKSTNVLKHQSACAPKILLIHPHINKFCKKPSSNSDVKSQIPFYSKNSIKVNNRCIACQKALFKLQKEKRKSLMSPWLRTTHLLQHKGSNVVVQMCLYAWLMEFINTQAVCCF